MNFFQKKTTWTNAEFIPLKLCIASIYLLIGAVLHDFVFSLRFPLLLLFVITMVWTMRSWLRKMKAENL